MNNTYETPAHLAGLNPQQLEAVQCRENIVFVNAGPGSGKTTLLVTKMIDHILTSHAPQKVVALSYTNTAARQIGERFFAKMDPSAAYDFFNGTIHSFCFRMMKAYYESTGRVFEYTILDDEELGELAREVSTQSGNATVEPVSYTHLDVYKRQHIHRYAHRPPRG